MRYLLDTTVCVDYLRGRKKTEEVLRATDPGDLWLSSIVVAELRFGADRSADPPRNHALVDILLGEIPTLAFDPDAARFFGRLRAELVARGQVIGPYDMLIAAHALSRGSILVTDNVSEFRRVDSLKVETWG